MKARQAVEISLGVVTSIGGFLDCGTLATSAQAGAEYRYQLIWSLLLGTVCVIFLVEMAGRLAAVSHHPLPQAVRERFGFNFYVWPLLASLIVDLLVLASEIGGACVAMQLVSGIAARWWAIPVALVGWLVLWHGDFGVIEKGVALLGLITLAFLVAAIKLHPRYAQLLHGAWPTLPQRERGHYWFLSVSIIGSIIAPFLLNFYSSGAVEDEWNRGDLGMNKIVATLGMGFGCIVSLGVLVTAALVLAPKGIIVDRYEQAALMLVPPLGKAGFFIFAGALFIACFGAAMEVSLDAAYMLAQSLGWNWGENVSLKGASRFHVVYSVFIFLASLLILCGIDPLKLTIFSMAITAVILPLVVLPFLVLMNDPKYLHEHRNGRIGNFIVFVIIMLTFVLAIVAIPLEIFCG
jgi:Mn2+/Fe2+ NRAMP family transporter